MGEFKNCSNRCGVFVVGGREKQSSPAWFSCSTSTSTSTSSSSSSSSTSSSYFVN